MDRKQFERWKINIPFGKQEAEQQKAILRLMAIQENRPITEQYPALREEYCQYTILPEQYAAKLLEF